MRALLNSTFVVAVTLVSAASTSHGLGAEPRKVDLTQRRSGRLTRKLESIRQLDPKTLRQSIATPNGGSRRGKFSFGNFDQSPSRESNGNSNRGFGVGFLGRTQREAGAPNRSRFDFGVSPQVNRNQRGMSSQEHDDEDSVVGQVANLANEYVASNVPGILHDAAVLEADRQQRLAERARRHGKSGDSRQKYPVPDDTTTGSPEVDDDVIRDLRNPGNIDFGPDGKPHGLGSRRNVEQPASPGDIDFGPNGQRGKATPDSLSPEAQRTLREWFRTHGGTAGPGIRDN